MDKQKEKVIDNYIIGQLIETDKLGISIYKAKHSVTGDDFILKKAPVSMTIEGVLESQRVNGLSVNSANFIYNEIQKIKQINCNKIIRCLQMIKTKRNIYLIYQSYPQYTLGRYLAQFNPSLQIRIFILKSICQVLQQIHRKCYVYLNLTPFSIFVDKNTTQLKFKDFEYAVKMGTLQQKKIEYPQLFIDNQYAAPQILSTNTIYYQSDIFSLGKIIQLLQVNSKQHISKNRSVKQCFDQIFDQDPLGRPTINKVWSCLKILENQNKIGNDAMSTRLKITVSKFGDRKFTGNSEINSPYKSPTKLGVPKQRKLVDEEEKKIKKLLKIRNLVLFLHDLANFSLSENDKQLFYLLLKKGVIIRANLLRQCKKICPSPMQGMHKQLKKIIQVLDSEQTSSLNLLTKIQQSFNQQVAIIDPKFKNQLQTRKQLSQSYLQTKIRDFITKKSKTIKVFHTSADTKQRNRLVYLCGMSQKLVYKSFQTFFDEVADQNIFNINQQKYFQYIRKGSTRQMLDRLDRIIKGKI